MTWGRRWILFGFYLDSFLHQIRLFLAWFWLFFLVVVINNIVVITCTALGQDATTTIHCRFLLTSSATVLAYAWVLTFTLKYCYTLLDPTRHSIHAWMLVFFHLWSSVFRVFWLRVYRCDFVVCSLALVLRAYWVVSFRVWLWIIIVIKQAWAFLVVLQKLDRKLLTITFFELDIFLRIICCEQQRSLLLLPWWRVLVLNQVLRVDLAVSWEAILESESVRAELIPCFLKDIWVSCHASALRDLENLFVRRRVRHIGPAVMCLMALRAS